MSFWPAALLAILSALPGLLLLAVTILFFLAFIYALINSPQLQFQFFMVGLMLAFLWYLYLHLPHFIRRLLSKLVHRSNRDDHGH